MAGTANSLRYTVSLVLPASAVAVVVGHATRPPRVASTALYETPMGIPVPVLLAAPAGVQILTG